MENIGQRLGAAAAQRLRIMSGLLFCSTEPPRYLKFPLVPSVPPTSNAELVPGVAGIIELVGGVLLMLGLFTRPVAFIASGLTAVAYFMAHAPRGLYPILNGGELAVLYCFVFLYIAAAGPGPWSIDAQRKR